ncbi:MAG: hypothetical protein ACRD1B_08355 [Thermoanaerobaculia bacterium]
MRSKLWPILLWPILVVVVYGAAIAVAQNDVPRGDLYSAKAIQALEQCFDSLGNFTCGGGVSGTGTTDTVAKWTAATMLGDSQIMDDGTDISISANEIAIDANTDLILSGATVTVTGNTSVVVDSSNNVISLVATDHGTTTPLAGQTIHLFPGDTFAVTAREVGEAGTEFRVFHPLGAGESGDYGLLSGFLPSLNGSDTVHFFRLAPSSAVSSGAGNIINGLRIDQFDTPGVGTVESALSVGSGWENFLSMNNAFVSVAGPPAGSASGTVASIAATLNAMNGGDTVTFFDIIPTNGNHTGAGNVLKGYNVPSITADAQAVATTNYSGSGWDAFVISEVDANGWSADDDPPTNSVALYFDESGANCNLIARLSDATEIVVSVLVVAGDCP